MALSKQAEMLLIVLRNGLFVQGEKAIRRERPITGKEIAARYNAKFPNDNVTDAKVREWVNELCSAGYPVCSSQQGYWYGTTAAEVEETLRHRKSRVKKQIEAIHGLEMALDRLKEGQLFETNPVVQTLVDEFDAERVS